MSRLQEEYKNKILSNSYYNKFKLFFKSGRYINGDELGFLGLGQPVVNIKTFILDWYFQSKKNSKNEL